jgi:hypothetical protein
MQNSKKFIASFLAALMIISPAPAAVLADSAPPDGSTQTVTDPSSSSTPADSSQSSTSQSPAPASAPSSGSAPASDPAPAPASVPTPVSSPAPAPDPTPSTGPSKPTGAIPAYAFNDATRHWEPTITSSFSWDAGSGLWMSPFYTYDPVVGWYHVKPTVTPSSAINGLTAGSVDPAGTLQSILGADPSNTNTGPGSNNNASLSNSNNLLATLINNLALSNYGSQTSASGDASVSGNTAGGGATSGAASVVNNLLNLLNAMWTFSTGGIGTFLQNIFGDHTGDINVTIPTASGGGGSVGSLACPAVTDQNSNTGPSSTNNASSNCNNNLTVNQQSNGSITNNLDLLAQSGNANVSGNTAGGNARSGDAQAELNIVNLINTAIGAGQSFFGMINIFGNLNGDILFPQLGLNGAVASSPSGGSASNTNTGPGSTNNASQNNQNNASLNNTASSAFNNNINASASSGAANVGGNTSAGTAQSGSANTNTNLFNLIDTSVFGDNAVLVLINDMGHWVGRIMNLGVSDTSGGGLLTSNATVSNNTTGPGSTNNASSSQNNNLQVNNTANGSITNNIHVAAHSGDANVTGNTKAGDATSGNANVATNIANIFGSQLNFKHIFGILIINVFGTWTGSVGVDTAAGNSAPTGSVGGSVVTNLAAGSMPVVAVVSGFFQNLAGTGSSSSSGGASNVSDVSGGGNIIHLAASHATPAIQSAQVQAKNLSWLLELAAGVLLLAGFMFGIERKLKPTALKK